MNFRPYALKNLINTLSNWDFIKNGRESGYSWCCIIWFKIRAIYMDLDNYIFNRYWTLPDDDQFQHVACPFHIIYYKNHPFKYYNCKKHNWEQFQIKDCIKCKNDNS